MALKYTKKNRLPQNSGSHGDDMKTPFETFIITLAQELKLDKVVDWLAERFAERQRQHELNIKLEALTDNTLIYRMWADEFGTPFDKAVMQFHYAVEAFGETVERFTKQ